MAEFFTSDTHYGHANIIKYSNRPYKSVEEMNEALIANYNSRVKDTDTCYHLGDVAFLPSGEIKQIWERLNGDKVLILGNHDSKENFVGLPRTKVFQYLEIRVSDPTAPNGYNGRQHIILLHYSMRVWNKSHRGTWQLYGHSHGTLPDDPNLLSMDVGVDPQKYFPISYDEVKAHMAKKTWKALDHHGRD